MDDGIRELIETEDSSVDYEVSRVLDLGSVFDVTRGSSSGGKDSNGQGLY